MEDDPHIYEDENQIHRSATIYKRWVFCCIKRHFLFVDGLLKEDVIMLNLYPDLKQGEEMEDSKREFIFVIDRSGKLYLLLTDLVSYICY